MNDTTGLAASSLILSFKPGISLVERSDGQAFLYASSLEIPLPQASPGLLASLRLLSNEGGAEEELANLMERHDGPWSLSTLFYYLQRFNQLGLLRHTLTWNGAELATIVPLSPTYRFKLIQPEPAEQYILSRFAYLRRDGRQFVLESPLGQAKLILHHPLSTAILHALAAQPLTLEALAGQFQEIPGATLRLFMSLLLCCEALTTADETGPAARSRSLAQWDFHDLLFHTRSRLGRHANPYGQHLRFLNRIPPLPAVKPPISSKTIPLYRPDIQTLQKNDLNFTQILEARRSYRQQGEQPIRVEEVGEFLFRAARVRAIFQAGDLLYEHSDRPYPSGGAGYELELYLAVSRCQGLPFGLYHYDPQAHQLYELASRPAFIHSLLDDAASSAGLQQRPQILIILAARFQRVSWKYESLAYALILKDVGVLYQTMYLVATAMKLAPCALGGGDSDLFAAAVGTDYYAETSVGEFILGSR